MFELKTAEKFRYAKSFAPNFCSRPLKKIRRIIYERRDFKDKPTLIKKKFMSNKKVLFKRLNKKTRFWV
jgi:hypothetical protein